MAPKANPCKMISGWTFRCTTGVKIGRMYTMQSRVPAAAATPAQNPSTLYYPEMERKRSLTDLFISVLKKG